MQRYVLFQNLQTESQLFCNKICFLTLHIANPLIFNLIFKIGNLEFEDFNEIL